MMATLDGTPTELDDAFVNLTLYGFGIYSSFIVSQGRLVRGWDYHVARIQTDAQQFLGLTVTRAEIENSVRAFVKNQPEPEDMTCRITVFPGDFNLGAPQAADRARLLVTGRAGSSLSGKPLNLWPCDCDRPFAQHKITNIGAAMKRRAEAKTAGFDDALFMAGDRITEGPTWNVFFIDGENIVTPPTDGRILPGVTRRIVMDILGDEGREQEVSTADLARFDGAFATNAAIGVVPIRAIGEVSYTAENPIVTRLQAAYRSHPKTDLF